MAIATSTILAITALSAAVIGAAGAIQQGQATKAQSKLQAGILEQQAARERDQAAADEEDFRVRQSRAMASRRAALGASGADPSSGSPLLVSEDFAGEVELSALRIRSGGEVRATRAEQQAVLQRFQGRQAARSSLFRTGSLLVSGGGKAFGQ